MTRDEFASLALSYLEEVMSYARRLCRSDWDADDLVQSVFEQAFRRWKDLSEPAQCRAWLFRIARNRHIDRVRRHRARSELRLVKPDDQRAPEPFVSPELIERTTAQRLELAIGRLNDEHGEALLLCDLWGFRYEEIADITGVPTGTVRSRISRARAQVADALRALEGDEEELEVKP